MTANQIRKSMGVKTTREAFRDDLDHYIKMEADRGNREMKYRIPDRYNNYYLVLDMTLELERDGFEVFNGNSGNLWDKDTLYISW